MGLITFLTYIYLFRAVLKFGHWKVIPEIDLNSVLPYLLKYSKSPVKHQANWLASTVKPRMRSFGLQGNVPLPHKKAKTVVRLAKNQNGCLRNRSICQWSHDSLLCFSALIGRPKHEGQLKKAFVLMPILQSITKKNIICSLLSPPM